MECNLYKAAAGTESGVSSFGTKNFGVTYQCSVSVEANHRQYPKHSGKNTAAQNVCEWKCQSDFVKEFLFFVMQELSHLLIPQQSFGFLQ